jgi:Ca2+-binding RTX toxin-like protein
VQLQRERQDGMATILGDNAGNILTGTNDGDLISGLDGDDDLFGLDGDDTLDGGLGDDSMSGADGNDTYIVDSAGDIVMEGSGKDIDTVVSSVTYTLGANLENLTLSALALGINGTGNTLSNVLTGNDFDNLLAGLAGNDTIAAGAGRDTVDGGMGADNMTGGQDDDLYIVDNLLDVVTESMDEGIDTVRSSVSFTLGDNVENLVITASGAASGTGNALDNVLTGGKGANALSGLDGNDSIDGGAGADKMTGGTGDDTYTVDNVKDLVIEAAMEGIDTVTSSVSFALGMNVENLILTGVAASNGTGNDLDNAITGNAGNNNLAGLGGSDSIDGGGGNDTLDGGDGDDTLDGGVGDDTYVVDPEGGDVLLEGVGEGTDTVLSAAASFTLLDNFENLTLVGDAVDGSGNDAGNVVTGNGNGNSLEGLGGNDTIRGMGGDDVLLGGDGSDSLDGGDGDDVLDGEAGADTMAGLAGNDIYLVDDAGDVVLEGAGKGGIDEVISQVSYTLGANIENLTLVGSGTVTGVGNTLANTIVSDSDSLLLGLAGNDMIFGSSGNDTINGGTGNDSMAGGAGDDGYTVDNVKDVVSEALMEGIDTVTSSVAFTLGMNVENLILTGTAALTGAGNELDNVIAGNSGNNKLSGLDGNDSIDGGAGNDTIDGGTGQDVLSGGVGNDSYMVDDAFGDIVLENDGEGTDTVFSSAANVALLANIENLTLIGAAMAGSGNDLDNVITGNDNGNSIEGLTGNDTIRGMGGGDFLFAGDGNDSVDGGLGDDFLDGETGADTMAGGAGNDSYVVDDAGDVIVEAGNGGIDEAVSLVSYTLGNGVENLTLFGTGLTGTGNALANVIVSNGENLLRGLAGNDSLVGSGGNDTLDGGIGGDTMTGGFGDDSYVVDSALDLIMENPGEGTDSVRSSISYTLGNDVENLTLSGRGHLNGTGNTLDNVIAGTTGNNQLSGLDGNDALLGGAGNDNLTGGTGMDTLTGGQGTDTLTGGADSDRFDVNSLDGSVDAITDFSSLAPAMGGDILDLADLLIGFDPMQSVIDNFVQYVQQGADTRVLVNADGAGNDFVAVAVLQGVAGVSAGQALANGNLDVTPDM